MTIVKSLKYEPEKQGNGYVHRTHRTKRTYRNWLDISGNKYRKKIIERLRQKEEKELV